MRESRRRLVASSFAGIVRRMIFGVMLLGMVAPPAATELCAKDKKRARAAKEQQQQQDDAVKDQTTATPQVQEKAPEKATEKAAVADKDKAQESTKAKDGDKTQETATVARRVDDSTRAAASLTQAKPAIASALEAARGSRDALRKIPGYTCTFSKQEQLKKGTPVRQTMTLKFRREPFSVYLKYVDPNVGREVIYVEGRNKGKLQVHEPSGLASLIGTITLSPTGSEAMKENKYPLTMIGMEKMLESFVADWEESQKHADTKVQLYPQAKFGMLDCTMYEVVHPQQRDAFKFHKSRVYFDKKTLLPIRGEQYAFPAKAGEEPQLVEEYTYTDVKTDFPLSETDFDVENERYGFK